MKRFFSKFCLATLIAFFSGCALGPVVDGTRFYVLSAQDYEPVLSAEGEEGVTLGLERVRIARYLDAPGIAVREEQNRIIYSQRHRWAESLEHGIAQLLTETLKQESAIDHIVPYPLQRRATPDYEVYLSLLRAEGVVDDRETRADFHAAWELRAVDQDEVLANGQVSESLPWNGEDFADLAASLSRGAAILSRDIALAVAEISGN